MPKKNNYTNATDPELISLYQRRKDNAALGTLLERYTLLLFGVGMKYLKDPVLSEDAVQQVFLKAIAHFPKGPIINFKGWLYILMRNYCLQQIRDRKYTGSEELLQNISGNEEANLEAAVRKNITLEEMHQCLQELKDDQRICLDAFYLRRQTYQMIMDQYGYTFAAVKTNIQNGKRNLRILLEQKPGLES